MTKERTTPGTHPDYPIEPMGRQSLVEVVSESLRDQTLQNARNIYIELSSTGSLITISREEHGLSISTENPDKRYGISQDEAFNILKSAVQLNIRLEKLDKRYANTLRRYNEYLIEKALLNNQAREAAQSGEDIIDPKEK
jgi:hypothetical protein